MVRRLPFGRYHSGGTGSSAFLNHQTGLNLLQVWIFGKPGRGVMVIVCHLAFGGSEFVPSDARFISTGCRANEMGRGEADWQLTNNKTATGIKPCHFFVPADMLTFSHRPNTGETRIANQEIRFDVQQGTKKAQGKGLGHYLPPLVRAAKSRARLAHFLVNGQRGKGKRHHKRHGKNHRVHMAIISHFGQMQQFCYIYVTFLWLSLADVARDMPVMEPKCDCGLDNPRVRA